MFGHRSPAGATLVDSSVWTPARHPLARLLRDVASGHFRDPDGGFTRVSPWSQQVQAILSLPGHAVLAVSYDVTDATLVDLGVDGYGGAHHPAVVTALAVPTGWIDTLDVLFLSSGTGSEGHEPLISRPDLAKLPLVERVRRTTQNPQVLGSRDLAEQDVVVISQGVAGVRQISFEVAASHRGRGDAVNVLTTARSCVPENELVATTVRAGNAAALRAVQHAGFAPVGSIQLFSNRPERRG